MLIAIISPQLPTFFFLKCYSWNLCSWDIEIYLSLYPPLVVSSVACNSPLVNPSRCQLGEKVVNSTRELKLVLLGDIKKPGNFVAKCLECDYLNYIPLFSSVCSSDIYIFSLALATGCFFTVAFGWMHDSAGMRIRFWPKNRLRGSIPQTKEDF